MKSSSYNPKFLQEARSIAMHAASESAKGEIEGALELYKRSLEVYMGLMKTKCSTQAAKDLLTKEISEHMDRAEELKTLINERRSEKPLSPRNPSKQNILSAHLTTITDTSAALKPKKLPTVNAGVSNINITPQKTPKKSSNCTATTTEGTPKTINKAPLDSGLKNKKQKTSTPLTVSRSTSDTPSKAASKPSLKATPGKSTAGGGANEMENIILSEIIDKVC
jgi:hypothetical protein